MNIISTTFLLSLASLNFLFASIVGPTTEAASIYCGVGFFALAGAGVLMTVQVYDLLTTKRK